MKIQTSVPTLAGVITLTLADASVTGLLWCLLADLCLLLLRLYTCNTLYVLFFLLLVLLQTLVNLYRLWRLLGTNCCNTATISSLAPWAGHLKVAASRGKVIGAYLLLNVGLFSVIVYTSLRIPQRVDDLEELCLHSELYVGLTSSMIYVICTQLAIILIPMLLLTAFNVCLGERSVFATNGISDVEVPTNEKLSSGKLNYALMTSGTEHDSGTYCRILLCDAFCSATVVFFRMAFAICSCASFEVYAKMMTLILYFVAAKCIFSIVYCIILCLFPRS